MVSAASQGDLEAWARRRPSAIPSIEVLQARRDYAEMKGPTPIASFDEESDAGGSAASDGWFTGFFMGVRDAADKPDVFSREWLALLRDVQLTRRDLERHWHQPWFRRWVRGQFIGVAVSVEGKRHVRIGSVLGEQALVQCRHSHRLTAMQRLKRKAASHACS